MTPLNSSLDLRIEICVSSKFGHHVFGHSGMGRRAKEPQAGGSQGPQPTAGARKRGAKRPKFLVVHIIRNIPLVFYDIVLLVTELIVILSI